MKKKSKKNDQKTCPEYTAIACCIRRFIDKYAHTDANG